MNFQIVIDKEQTILRKNNLIAREGGSKTNEEITSAIDKRIDFLLCPSCFWCASFFNFGELSIIRCPNCYNGRINQLLINNKEVRNMGERM